MTRFTTAWFRILISAMILGWGVWAVAPAALAAPKRAKSTSAAHASAKKGDTRLTISNRHTSSGQSVLVISNVQAKAVSAHFKVSTASGSSAVVVQVRQVEPPQEIAYNSADNTLFWSPGTVTTVDYDAAAAASMDDINIRYNLRSGGLVTLNITPAIVAESQRQNLDPLLVKSVIKHESGFNNYSLSPVGAAGLMQLMPSTAAGLGLSDVYDPLQNIAGGVRYLRGQLDRFGSIELALAAYNAGPGAVLSYGGIPPFAETQAYVNRILTDYLRYRAGLGR